MILTAVLTNIVILIIAVIFSRTLLLQFIKKKSERKLRRLNKGIYDLQYSFEETIYFVSLPNRNPVIYRAGEECFKAVPDFKYFIFPEVAGLKIFLKLENGEINIAYMSLDQFRIPVLERLKHEKSISKLEYNELRTYVLLHPVTRKAFIEETQRQLKREDRILIMDESVL